VGADTLIRNGLLVDGSGSRPRRGNLAIASGRIVGVGDVEDSAGRVIDADGLVVAPGFWDIYTHYDVQLLWDPLVAASSAHGVTTLVTGNCGFSPAPCRADDQSWMTRTLARLEGVDVERIGNSKHRMNESSEATPRSDIKVPDSLGQDGADERIRTADLLITKWNPGPAGPGLSALVAQGASLALI